MAKKRAINPNLCDITRLTAADIAAAMQLTQPVGWNQTENDWRRVLTFNPDGCFAARLESNVVGTVTTMAYGKALAWIGMMMVDARFRRRGIATALMRTALDHLRHLRVGTIKLDATPVGRPLYESLGFKTEVMIERWEAVAAPVPSPQLQFLDTETRPHVYALDKSAFGADRERLLNNLIADGCVPPLVIAATPGAPITGYGLARRGSRAFYVGPLIAREESSALALLDGMLKQLAGQPVYLDIHTGFPVVPKLFARRGFRKQRELARMCYGEPSAAGRSSMILAIAGPELG